MDTPPGSPFRSRIIPVTIDLLRRSREAGFLVNERGLWPLAGDDDVVLCPGGDIDFPVLKRVHEAAMQGSIVHAVGQWDDAFQDRRLRDHFDPSTLWAITVRRVTRGFIRLVARENLLIEQFYLEPKYQRTGLGGRVLDAVLAVADEAGVSSSLTVLKGSRARAFYERHGFYKSGEDAWEDYMTRDPSPSGV